MKMRFKVIQIFILIIVAQLIPSYLSSTLSMLGADVSSLQRAEELGQKYYDANRKEGEAMDILKGIGVNYIRLRIWNNPASHYNNKEKVLAFVKKVKAKGLKLMIDFHYSDTWADPGAQFKPAAWANHNITKLTKDVYDYTLGVCESLKAHGATPDSVQIGNEINTGMLWNDGRVVHNNFKSLASLLKAGYDAIKKCNSDTQVVIHTAHTNDDSHARWFYDGIKAEGVHWDITALSYYCFWHGSMSNMEKVVADMVSRYNKPVILAETYYPWTHHSNYNCSGYDQTAVGQAKNFADVLTHAKNGGAIGVFYWEPTWVATKGNGFDTKDIEHSETLWATAIFDSQAHLNPNVKWTP